MTKLSNIDIDALEHSLGVALPGLYRKLLVEMGHGSVGEHAEIYHPSAVRKLYEPFFDDPTQLFKPYFPFGCHNLQQTLWVIDSTTEKAASIWHETVPDDWPEEKWLPYENWVQRNLSPQLDDA